MLGVAHREHALVLGEAGEVREQAVAVVAAHEVVHALARRVRHQRGAHVEVAHEPAEDQPVDQRHDPVAEQPQREQQRQHESEGQAHGSPSATGRFRWRPREARCESLT